MYEHTFLYYLKPTNDTNTLKRYFKEIQFVNGYRLSIQLSPLHYCKPRAMRPINEYTHAEIAFGYQELDFVSAHGGAVPQPLADRLEKFREGTAYFTVPVELVQEVFDHMAKTHKLNRNEFRI